MNIKKMEEIEKRDENPRFNGDVNPNSPQTNYPPAPPAFEPEEGE